MTKITLLTLLALLPLLSFAQNPHWEGVVYANDTWAYHEGSSAADADWNTNTFDASQWKTGQGGFGYSDNDDNTTILKVPTVYTRINFEVRNKEDILNAVIQADFDDGIILYLNGQEVGRSCITTTAPSYDSYASASHEAQMYQGLDPQSFALGSEQLNKLLVNGTNTLAAEVHNVSATSSDLSAIVYLSFEIAKEDSTYRDTPPCFRAPEVVSSSLPLIVISTEEPITATSKISGRMKIVNHKDGQSNKITDKATDYEGYIGVKIRGNVSASYPQKPYNIETRDSLGENLNVSLFGMPKENDWALVNNYKDKTCLKHALGYEISRQMGHWAAHTQHCEVVVNGEAQGIYVFMESLKRDDDRVAIAKLKEEEIDSTDLTGGYIFKVDYYDKNSSFDNWIASYQPPHNSTPVHFVYKYPEPEDIVAEQKEYIQNYVEGFEEVLYSDRFADPECGYRAWINVPSFINYLLVQEVALNNDGYKKSCHFHKDKDRKNIKALLNAGPVWDMDWGFREQPSNSNDPARSFLTGFEYERTLQQLWPTPVTWMVRLMEDEQFKNETHSTYFHYRDSVLSTAYLLHFVDSLAALIKPNMERHYEKWYNSGATGAVQYQSEVNTLKDFISYRMDWLDAEMPGELIAMDEFLPSPITYIDTSLVTKPLRINNLAQARVHLYPTPAQNYVYISGAARSTYQIVSSEGRTLSYGSAEAHAPINISNLHSGLYIIKVRDAMGKMNNLKLQVVR